MRSPHDFEAELSSDDLEQVAALIESIEKWFDDDHNRVEYETSTNARPPLPQRVWDEAARRIRATNTWDLDYHAAVFIVRKPGKL